MDIFLSYSRHDRDLAKALVDLLTDQGLSVFWDNEIAPGENWEDRIHEALKASRLVIVLWSASSAESPMVKSEADLAARADKLFPVMVDRVQLPIQFAKYNSVMIERSNAILEMPHIVRLVLGRLEGPGISERRAVSKRRVAASRPDGFESVLDVDAAPEEIGEEVEYSNATYSRPRAARNATIFIAHATADKPKLKPIVELLLENRFRLWIDKPQSIGLSDRHSKLLAKSRIKFEGDWKEQINRAARKATKILACWSKDAIQGRREQFHYEVYMGLISEKLTQCRIDDVSEFDVGFPYNFGQIADLSNFNRERYLFEFQFMMDDLASPKRSRFLPKLNA